VERKDIYEAKSLIELFFIRNRVCSPTRAELHGSFLMFILENTGRVLIMRRTEDDFRKKFEGKYPDFEYVSGYIGSELPFLCKCKKCGSAQERNAQCAKPSKKYTLSCDNCMEVEREAKQEAERNKKRKQNEYTETVCAVCGKTFLKQGSAQKYCSDECLKASLRSKYVSKARPKKKVCAECGKGFITYKKGNRKHCSEECKNKLNNRRKETRRRHKLKQNGKIDYSVSLNKLYQRDKGICHICGKKCNLKDYTRDNYIFIAGETYPSIDHVIPVSKGGTHTWNNVRLAHMYCNAIKRDILYFEKDNGQITLAI
jgi:5-methylcytosine-specific restriction endonuclease McrA